MATQAVITTPSHPPHGPAAAKRLISLDVFRGLTIASMVLVNNQVGAGAYLQLRHASWHGWTSTDLVFPFFLWIAGVATTLSTARRVERGDDRWTLLGHVVRRAALLFLIGVALNFLHHPDLATLRIPDERRRWLLKL